MKKNAKILIAALLIVLGVAGGLFLSNLNYFIEKGYAGKQISNSDMRFVNWQDLGNGGQVSLNDPQIIFSGVSGYVDELRLNGTFDGTLNVQVFYTDKAGANFTEEQSIFPTVTQGKNGLIIPVDRQVIGLRVDLADGAGFTLRLAGGYVYSSSFAFDLLPVLSGAFIGAAFAIPVFFPPRRWKNIIPRVKILHRYTHLLSNLVKRDITTKYRRSVLGLLWSVLNPLLMMLVISAVFQRLLKVQVANFPVYFLSGNLIFNFMSEATNGSMGSILHAGSFIRKVYIPKYILPFEKCLFALVNSLFAFVAVLIVLLVQRMPFHATLLLFWVPLLYVFVFNLGFGMILACLEVFFRDTQHLYGVWLTAWMYLTPIIYATTILPDAVFTVVKLNPMYYYVTYFRELVLYGNLPTLRENLICILISLSFLMVGGVVFKRLQDKFIYHI